MHRHEADSEDAEAVERGLQSEESRPRDGECAEALMVQPGSCSWGEHGNDLWGQDEEDDRRSETAEEHGGEHTRWQALVSLVSG